MTPRRFLAVAILLVLAVGPAFGAASSDPLAGLRAGHPRLLATADDWARLRARVDQDPQLARLNTAVFAEARQLLARVPVRREMTGRRLLGVSRNLVGRVLALGYAWRMTDDVAFARRAETEMLAAAAFSDWNPSHFLDVGEATAALAIGYDWCHAALTPDARTAIRAALVAKGLQPALDPTSRHLGWQSARNNWNQVCFGGLALGALAIAEDEPAIAREMLARARAGIGHGLAPYAPDGVYPEGPSYWAYGTSYQVLLVAALESALGTDWNLAARPGFLPSAGAVLQTTGATGLFYNFADGGERAGFEPALFWFARRLHDPGLLQFNLRYLESSGGTEAVARNRFAPLAALWWPDASPADTAPALPLRWMGRGPNPVGVFRESWTDPAGYYLAFKGGAAELNHAHMDAGSFVFESDGVRWAVDLGAQDYESLESKGVDLWNRRQDSQRWQVYRLNNHSHSTLTLGGRLHRAGGHARLTHFSAADAHPAALVDLTPVFAGQAAQVRRGFRLLPDRRVLIQDEVAGLAPGTEVRWQMPTRAAVTTQGTSAVLRQNGRALHVALAAPGAAAFSVAPAEPPPDAFNARNPGVSMLSATIAAPADGNLRLAVVLSPGGSPPAAAPTLAPLDTWLQPADQVPAPQPLFRDPVFDGAADPVVVWNPAVKRWWMFYTNRRANAPGLSGVAWVHGCRLGIAESVDGSLWTYLGTADIELPPEVGGAEPTHWAPEVITAAQARSHVIRATTGAPADTAPATSHVLRDKSGSAPGDASAQSHVLRDKDAGSAGTPPHPSSAAAAAELHHMFLTVVPGVFENWQHPRHLVHLTSTDLRKWTYRSTLQLASDRVIDAGVHALPGGGWRLWYNNERDRKSIYYADSPDLFAWTDRGKCTGVGERPGEGPFVFRWRGTYWMLVDLWRGLGVYRSTDLANWIAQPDNLLGEPGHGPDDGVNGGHPGVVVDGNRAYLFYFTHPGRNGTISPDDKANLELRRSSIQVVELHEKDGRLSCDRDAPTHISLTPPDR